MRFIHDPVRGWLEVTFYLEEDCDAPTFIAAYRAKHGAEPQITEVHQEVCHIRDTLVSGRRVEP